MMPSRLRREQGQDLVEYALILPILLVLLLGVVEFGLIIFSNNTIGDAAEQGARYGVIHPTDTGGIQAKIYAVTDAAALKRANVTILSPTLSGGTIRVEVRYSYYSPTKLFDAFIGRPFVLKAVATMVIE